MRWSYATSIASKAYLRYVLVSKETYNRPKETYLYAKRDLQMTSIAEVKRGLLQCQKRPTNEQKIHTNWHPNPTP